MSKWIDIAERCEKATGPDREIDWAIYKAMFASSQGFSENERNFPYYTGSIDAITALIDRELPRSMRSIRKHPDGEAVAQVWNSQVVGETPRQRCCASEALALCAAFCRAMNQADGKAVERKNAFENGCGNG